MLLYGTDLVAEDAVSNRDSGTESLRQDWHTTSSCDDTSVFVDSSAIPQRDGPLQEGPFYSVNSIPVFTCERYSLTHRSQPLDAVEQRQAPLVLSSNQVRHTKSSPTNDEKTFKRARRRRLTEAANVTEKILLELTAKRSEISCRGGGRGISLSERRNLLMKQYWNNKDRKLGGRKLHPTHSAEAYVAPSFGANNSLYNVASSNGGVHGRRHSWGCDSVAPVKHFRTQSTQTTSSESESDHMNLGWNSELYSSKLRSPACIIEAVPFQPSLPCSGTSSSRSVNLVFRHEPKTRFPNRGCNQCSERSFKASKTQSSSTDASDALGEEVEETDYPLTDSKTSSKDSNSSPSPLKRQQKKLESQDPNIKNTSQKPYSGSPKSSLKSLSIFSQGYFSFNKQNLGFSPAKRRACSSPLKPSSFREQHTSSSPLRLVGKCSKSLDELSVDLKEGSKHLKRKINFKSIMKDHLSQSCNKLNGDSEDEEELVELEIPGDRNE
ncbi:uncharacterized protein LOC125178711 [Hyalella azteca]|uniref:Uncharacterized protein LOC125178711 n=1 Tax=Hyalella azteca TaxID=294128 RepID=A0A979FPP9_HYAAZ|nr:uncharacterized protein LOC125178711 [Hyalella azteca]